MEKVVAYADGVEGLEEAYEGGHLRERLIKKQFALGGHKLSCNNLAQRIVQNYQEKQRQIAKKTVSIK